MAISLFTAIPAGVSGTLDDDVAARAILWLPAIGLLLGGVGGGVMLAAGRLNATGPGRLLGAALAVAAIAVLTGGLHLDGLADTADGLGSRRPAADALEIMRRPDIGPMGVGALVLALLIQVTAVAAVPRLPLATAALVLAEVTGRVSVVIATSSPAARPGGFGALVADRTTAAERALTASALACAVAAAGLTAGGPALAVRGLAATLAGLLAGWLLQRTARRRLGGTTGDVFGAILQVSATTALVVAALVS
ncbi:MAG: adenosylcobinamide-GDP ribazoletransferase [Trebonia sp.]|jgi:adenosylcobinamide-GDP ribazoletransferase|nr:adenosylcobinamide-GDP ribazoletransferase [Trebonia sp.]